MTNAQEVDTPRKQDGSDELCPVTASHDYDKTSLSGVKDYCKLCVHPIANFEIVGKHDHNGGVKAPRACSKKTKKKCAATISTPDTSEALPKPVKSCCSSKKSFANETVLRSSSSLEASSVSCCPRRKRKHTGDLNTSLPLSREGILAKVAIPEARDPPRFQTIHMPPATDRPNNITDPSAVVPDLGFFPQPLSYQDMSSLLLENHYDMPLPAARISEQMLLQPLLPPASLFVQPAAQSIPLYTLPQTSRPQPLVEPSYIPTLESLSPQNGRSGCCGDGHSCSCGNDCACDGCIFHTIASGLGTNDDSYLGQNLIQPSGPLGEQQTWLSFDIPHLDQPPELDAADYYDVDSDGEEQCPGAVFDTQEDGDAEKKPPRRNDDAESLVVVHGRRSNEAAPANQSHLATATPGEPKLSASLVARSAAYSQEHHPATTVPEPLTRAAGNQPLSTYEEQLTSWQDFYDFELGMVPPILPPN